jgi:hypothetical protein
VSTLALCVVAANAADLRRYDLSTVEADVVTLVVNSGARYGGYGVVGQRFLDQCQADVFGLVHADVTLSPEVCRSLVEAAMAGCVTGVVGRSLSRTYVWSRDVRAGEVRGVSTLDSCSMFVSVALARSHGLAFDTKTFDDFHLCVEDFCLQAASVGVPVVVAPGPASHAGQMYVGPDRLAWRERYKVYRERLDEKWRGTEFITT